MTSLATIATIGSTWRTPDGAAVVVVELREHVVVVRDEATGEVFGEVAAFAARTWTAREAADVDAA